MTTIAGFRVGSADPAFQVNKRATRTSLTLHVLVRRNATSHFEMVGLGLFSGHATRGYRLTYLFSPHPGELRYSQLADILR